MNKHFNTFIKSILVILFLQNTINCHTSSLQKNETSASKKEQLIATELMIVKNNLDEKQHRAAWNNIQNLKRNFPNHPDVLNLLGIVYLSLGNFTNAYKSFEKAQKFKSDAKIGLNKAIALIALNRPKEAIKSLNSLLEKYENYKYKDKVYYNLALIYIQKKKSRQAQKYLQASLSENPNNYLSLLQLGKIFKKEKKSKQAKYYFLQAIETCYFCLEPVKEIIKIFLKEKNKEKAKEKILDFLKRNKKKNKDYKKAQTLLAQIHKKLN